MQQVNDKKKRAPDYVTKITLYLVLDGLIEGDKGNQRFRGTPEEVEQWLRNEFANHVLNATLFGRENNHE